MTDGAGARPRPRAPAARARRAPRGASANGCGGIREPIRRAAVGVVGAYAFFVAVPAFLPLPADDAHAVQQPRRPRAVAVLGPVVAVRHPVDVRRRARVVRRLLSRRHADRGGEPASDWARAVPRWMKWGGWPFVAFALTTVFGQLVSVYQYPAGDAARARRLDARRRSASGFVYGRGKRVWCRHLCPVNGVFAVLSRVSPLHFRVDTARVDGERRAHSRASGQLRAAGAHPPDDGPVRMPHVRPLQRPARRDRARRALAEPRSGHARPTAARADGTRCSSSSA